MPCEGSRQEHGTVLTRGVMCMCGLSARGACWVSHRFAARARLPVAPAALSPRFAVAGVGGHVAGLQHSLLGGAHLTIGLGFGVALGVAVIAAASPRWAATGAPAQARDRIAVGHRHLNGSGPPIVLAEVVCNLVALVQDGTALHGGDVGMVDKDVRAALGGRREAETLLAVEPLDHASLRHSMKGRWVKTREGRCKKHGQRC